MHDRAGGGTPHGPPTLTLKRRRIMPPRRTGKVVAAGDAATADRLVGILARFSNRRVVVLGDLVADEFVYGDIDRISREAPVLILTHRRTEIVPGAAGNAVANLKALGADPIPIGVVGRDDTGRSLLAELRRRRVRRTGIVVSPGYETPRKSRLLAGGVHTRRQQIARLDRGPRGDGLPRALQSELYRKACSALDRADGLLLADYGYGTATPALATRLAPLLAKYSLPLLVDSRTRVAAFRGATACTPNQEELERALDLPPLERSEEIDEAGRRLLRKTGDDAVLLTRGARGMVLFQRRRTALHVPPFGSDEVADVTGAGDTVIAVFTLALLAGAGFADAARLSNYAAGLVVMKAGTATVDAAELAGAIREDLEGGGRE
jgi:rfaE bifunctional protein kinase chain/domain